MAKRRRSPLLSLPWEQAKGKIQPALAPRDWVNVKGISAARRDFLDLAVYYYMRMECGELIGSVWIDESLRDGWGVDMDELHAQAMENMKKVSRGIEELGSVIGKEPVPDGVHLLTNAYGFYGAAALLDKGRVSAFAAEKGADLYILPASVHEALLMPILKEGREIDPGKVNWMVRECNQAAVIPEERLADHAYRYNRKTDEIQIVE